MNAEDARGAWCGALVLAAAHAFCFGFDDEAPRTGRAPRTAAHHTAVLRALDAARSSSWRPGAGTARAYRQQSNGTFALPDADVLVYTAAAVLAAACVPYAHDEVYSARPRYATAGQLRDLADGVLENELRAAGADHARALRLRARVSLCAPERNFLAFACAIEDAPEVRGAAYAGVRNCLPSVPRSEVHAAFVAGGAPPRALEALDALFSAWAAPAGLPVYYVASNMLVEYWLVRINAAAPRAAGVRYLRFADDVVVLSRIGPDDAYRAVCALAAACDPRLDWAVTPAVPRERMGELFALLGAPLRAAIPEFARDVVAEATRSSPCVSGYITIDYAAVRDTAAGRAFNAHMRGAWHSVLRNVASGAYGAAQVVVVPLCAGWLHIDFPAETLADRHVAFAWRVVLDELRVWILRRMHAPLSAADARVMRYLLDVLPDDIVTDVWLAATGADNSVLAGAAAAALRVR